MPNRQETQDRPPPTALERLAGALLLAAAVFMAFAGLGPARAETLKIGLILTYSGPEAAIGQQIDRGFALYLEQNSKALPPGTTIEIIRRDDTGPNPDVAKRLAQELITREKVNMLAGVIWTPNANAIAPLATQAKIPFLILNAATSATTTLSPYIARVSLTLWQASYPLGRWAASAGAKKVYSITADYAPGHDGEEAFKAGLEKAGGAVVGSVRVPMSTRDFAPYFQRAKDSGPDAIYLFTPGQMATAAIKSYHELGLAQAGIKLIGPASITSEDELPALGEAALGIVSASPYVVIGFTEANTRFLEAWTARYGADSRPTFQAVSGWDGMDAVFQIAQAMNGGPFAADKAMQSLKSWSNSESPRGPVSMDPDTRDIVQNIYIARVERTGGKIANVPFHVFEAVKDPWKELAKK